MRNKFLASLLPLVALMGCEAMQGETPMNPAGVMKSVSSLSTSVATWSQALSSGNITDVALTKLGGMLAPTGQWNEVLKGMIPNMDPNKKQLAGGVSDGLGKLSSFNVDDMMKLAPMDRQKEVQEITGITKKIGDLAKQFTSA